MASGSGSNSVSNSMLLEAFTRCENLESYLKLFLAISLTTKLETYRKSK